MIVIFALLIVLSLMNHYFVMSRIMRRRSARRSADPVIQNDAGSAQMPPTIAAPVENTRTTDGLSADVPPIARTIQCFGRGLDPRVDVQALGATADGGSSETA